MKTYNIQDNNINIVNTRYKEENEMSLSLSLFHILICRKEHTFGLSRIKYQVISTSILITNS